MKAMPDNIGAVSMSREEAFKVAKEVIKDCGNKLRGILESECGLTKKEAEDFEAAWSKVCNYTAKAKNKTPLVSLFTSLIEAAFQIKDQIVIARLLDSNVEFCLRRMHEAKSEAFNADIIKTFLSKLPGQTDGMVR